MTRIVLKSPFTRNRPDGSSGIEQVWPSSPGRNFSIRALLSVACVCMFALSPSHAADRTTCQMIVKLLEATDRGLEAAAAGNRLGSTSGVAVIAQQAQETADRHSRNDPLPDAVAAALAAIEAAASTHYFIAEAAPVLLAKALILQRAMPEVCAGLAIPDLNRHVE